MSKSNPKPHDNLFKWLIRSFIYDFLAYFFPNVKVKNCKFIDKEFISKYEALKDSLKGDLFIAAELEIDGQISEIVIHHENQSNRESLEERVFEYLCYAWLLKRKPVWSIVFYTDDAIATGQVSPLAVSANVKPMGFPLPPDMAGESLNSSSWPSFVNICKAFS